jgi:two-component system, NarL family, sensor kinase
MKHFYIFLLIVLNHFFVYAQTKKSEQKLDSLLDKLKTAKEDTNKVKLLAKIGNKYQSNNYILAKKYIEDSKKLSDKLGYKSGIEGYYLNIHAVYLESGKYDSSIILLKKGFHLIEKSGNKVRLARFYQGISNGYHYLLKFDSCMKYDLKAQEILEKLDNKDELVVFYGNLGSAYNEQHKFDLGEKYGLKAYSLSKEGYGDDNDLVYVLNNLATTYIYLNDYDKAFNYGKKCIELCKKEKNYSVLQVIIENMILVKIEQKQYKEILVLVADLKEMGKTFDSIEYRARLDLNYMIANFYNGNIKLAKEYAHKALAVSVPNKLSVITKNSYIMLDKIEAILGNYDLSDLYGEKRDSINQMQISIESTKNIQDLEKKYETQKKETEIIKLNAESKQKTTNNKILIGLFSGLSILSLLGYRNFKTRQQIQNLKISELEKDKQLLSVDAMLRGQEEERNRIAKDLHDGLGGMLSSVKMSFNNMKENLIMSAENVASFETSIGQLDNTIVELRKIAHNLMPEALVKFGLSDAINDFCTSLTQATHIHITYESLGETRRLDNTSNTYIYRIVQELINNALKHGKPKDILVQMTTTPTKILLTVEDNGTGMDANKMAASKGLGLTNIRHRVNYLKGNIEFENNLPQGTVVNIELNV